MLDRHLKKITSQSESAGLFLTTNVGRQSFSLFFNGFNDKMETFVEMVLSEMKAFIENMDQSVFNLVKNDLKKGYRNSLQNNKHLCNELLTEIVKHDYYTDIELYEEIDNVSFESLQKFVQKFFQNLKIQVLVQGNMTKSHALKLVNILQTHIACEPLDDEYELLVRNYALPTGTNVLRTKSLRPNNDNTYTEFFHQVLDVTLRSRSLCQLVASILDPKAFHYLRNQEQLGYSVGIRYFHSEGIIGLATHVISQERKHRYSKVQSKMESFISEVAKNVIEELTEEEFETFKESRIKSLLADFSSAQAEATANWKEITQQDYIFDRYELSAKVTGSLTKQDLLDFFNSTTQENFRKLSIAVIGSAQQSEVEGKKNEELKAQLITDKLTENENVIADIEEFRNRLELQPVLKFAIE